jgi:hypothetical protein
MPQSANEHLESPKIDDGNPELLFHQGVVPMSRTTSAGLAGIAIALALAFTVTADDPKKDDDKKGTVTGIVTAKGDNWIEVKADGEEKPRRYVPFWKGGLPKDGGGPDKDVVAKIKDVPLKARIRLEWVFNERPRVEKIEVLKKEKE